MIDAALAIGEIARRNEQRIEHVAADDPADRQLERAATDRGDRRHQFRKRGDDGGEHRSDHALRNSVAVRNFDPDFAEHPAARPDDHEQAEESRRQTLCAARVVFDIVGLVAQAGRLARQPHRFFVDAVRAAQADQIDRHHQRAHRVHAPDHHRRQGKGEDRQHREDDQDRRLAQIDWARARMFEIDPPIEQIGQREEHRLRGDPAQRV